MVSVNMRYVLCRPKLEVITSQSLCIFVAVFRPIAPGRLVASFCLLFSSVRRTEEGPSSSFFSIFPFSAEGLSKGGRKGGRRTQGPERHSTHYKCQNHQHTLEKYFIMVTKKVIYSNLRENPSFLRTLCQILLLSPSPQSLPLPPLLPPILLPSSSLQEFPHIPGLIPTATPEGGGIRKRQKKGREGGGFPFLKKGRAKRRRNLRFPIKSFGGIFIPFHPPAAGQKYEAYTKEGRRDIHSDLILLCVPPHLSKRVGRLSFSFSSPPFVSLICSVTLDVTTKKKEEEGLFVRWRLRERWMQRLFSSSLETRSILFPSPHFCPLVRCTPPLPPAEREECIFVPGVYLWVTHANAITGARGEGGKRKEE